MHCSHLLFLAQAVPFTLVMGEFSLQTGVWMSLAQEEHCRGRQLYESGLTLESAWPLS